jgi:DNA polymerase III alpha subunit
LLHEVSPGPLHPAPAIAARDGRRQAIRSAHHYRDLFGPDNFWIELQHHYRPGDDYLVSQLARVAGLLVVHQSPPTAKGFHFLALETETGLVNVIVRPAVYRQYSPLLRTAQLLLVAGVVQQEEGITNVLAAHISRLDA